MFFGFGTFLPNENFTEYEKKQKQKTKKNTINHGQKGVYFYA